MANTYTQIHIHTVFAVKYRTGLIQPDWKDELYKYITGIIQSGTHKVLAINGMPDHLHITFGMRPVQSLSNLLQEIKGGSSLWINEHDFVKGKFEWQEGFGAFSYHKSILPEVVGYIHNQTNVHAKKSFREEYLDLLREYDVAFDERYIFKELI